MQSLLLLNTPQARKVCSNIVRRDMIAWLDEYVGDDNFIIHYRINTMGTFDDQAIEFLHDEDAIQFRLKFGL